MKIIKSTSYQKLIKSQFENIRTEEDFIMEQNTALLSDINSYLQERLQENPHMSIQDMFQDVKYEYIDDEDYNTAPEYASRVESLISSVVNKIKQDRISHKSEYDQDTY